MSSDKILYNIPIVLEIMGTSELPMLEWFRVSQGHMPLGKRF